MLQLSSLSIRSTCERNILRQQQRVKPSLSSTFPTSTSTLGSPFSSRSPTCSQNYSHLCAITFPQLKQRTGIIMLRLRYIIALTFESQMRPNDKKLEGKVGKYREEKARAGKLESFMSEKRRNIEKLMQEHTIEPEPELDLQKFANDIDLKHQRYLDDMSALEDTRMAIIEARGALEGLQLEMSLQEQSLDALKKTATREVGAQEEVLSQLKGRLQGQRAQRAKMEEERCQRQLDHVQKLTNQKEELIGRTEDMLRKRKGLDLALKRLKQNFEEDYKTQRQEWLRVQNERRDKWQAKKQQEINQGTLKSIQPEIARIVGAGKQEIAKLQQRYESIRNEYTKEMNQQFEDNLRMIRSEITQRLEADTSETVQRIGEQQRKLMERLIANFQAEKGRLKIGKEAEVRQLQSRRKKQAEEFMVRNKDYLLSHLGEVKQVKANYESEIRQLDGSLDKQLWKEQAVIKERCQKKIQAHREQKRKELQGKVRAYHIQQKKQSESLYQDIVQKVAVENQTMDSELRRQTDAKIRQYKQNHQAELKSLRKQLQVLMGKQRKEQQAMRGVKQARESIQQQHEQLLRENQYLRKKEIEFQAEVVRLKVKEDDFQSAQEKDLQRIKQQWQEQLDLLEKKIIQAESEMQTQERIMGEKQEQERGKIITMMNKLEKEGVLLVKKLNEDIERARKERGVKVTLSGKLAEMKKKLKDMEAKRRK